MIWYTFIYIYIYRYMICPPVPYGLKHVETCWNMLKHVETRWNHQPATKTWELQCWKALPFLGEALAVEASKARVSEPKQCSPVGVAGESTHRWWKFSFYRLYIWLVFWNTALAQIPDSGRCRVPKFGRLNPMIGSSDQQCFSNLFVPTWTCLSNGATVSVVLDSMIWCDNAGVGRAIPGGQVVRVCGLIPPEAAGASKISVLGASFLSCGAVVDLVLDANCTVLAHKPLCVDHVFNLVELCSGVGLSSVGFSRAGFTHKCSVEKQPKLAELHLQLHPGVPVVCSDVALDSTAGLVFAHCPDPCTLMSGIACQPYSRGGSQQGGLDNRSASLPGTLRMLYLLQSPALVLECVVPARDNLFVRGHLKALIDQLGYSVVDCALKLEEVWAACRYRWWVVATHPCIGPVSIPTYPKGSTLVVRDLMPYVHRWPPEVEEQLILTPAELSKFQLAGQTMRQHQVKPDAKLPTALHSWGNQTVPCACDCRTTGFSDELLASKGVYAQLLQLPANSAEAGAWRHLHALEVSMLNGVPLNLRWGDHHRLNLCAVGQMASPMQSIWIAAALARHVQTLFTTITPADPLSLLQALKNDIMQQCRDLFPNLPSQPSTPDRCQIVVQQPGQQNWTLAFPPTAVVKDLIVAHGRLNRVPFDEVWIKDQHENLVTHEVPLSKFTVLSMGRYEDLFPIDDPEPQPEPCNAPMDLDLGTQLDFISDGESPAPHHESTSGGTAKSTPAPVEVMPSTSDSTVQSLLHLTPNQLVDMLAPLVLDLDLCHRMRAPSVSVDMRMQLLAKQDHVWADDEMWWHLQVIAATEPSETAILDPLLALTWLTSGSVETVHVWATSQPKFTRLVSAVCHNGHWTPCLWVFKHVVVEVIMWEHEDTDVNGLNQLHGLLSQAFGLAQFCISCTRRSFGSQLCGAATIAFLQHRLNGLSLPSSQEQLKRVHDGLKEDFRMSHEGFAQMPRPWCWGAGIPDVVSLVGSLLQQHGVPANASANRAKLLVQSLGMDTVKQAVQGVSPWKSLKNLANQQTPPFQLVLPDELNAVVQDRKTKKQKAVKVTGHRIAPTKPMDIDPTKLSLTHNTFQMEAGQPAPQLPASQVGPLAVGVALVTMQDALPFLRAGQLLTSKSLALLVINGPDELPTKLSWSSIRFAACCSVNQQPVLLQGHLVQLGSQLIVPVFTKEGPGVPDVPVTCARVTVFADQWPHDWNSLSDHPFKQALQVLMPLQTCRTEACQCGKWHPDSMDESQDVLLDVFRRQYFTEAGRPTKHAQANHFSVQIRYLKCQELALLRLSGQNGVFIEPRVQDASAPSDEFQVVWLPQVSFASAQHQLQCEPMGLGLARSGRRFGIRVAAKDFQALFQKLKPEGQFLSPGTRQTWHCGPFPFGSDRKSIGRVFAEWKWQARPLQPARPIANGVMWLVQSVTDPPQTVFNMQHGQVMISKCDSVRAGMADNGTVIGPQSTIELCASSSTVDPWTIQDPWQQALNQVPVQQPAPVQSHIQELEDRLERSILEKLPVERMETDDTEDRLQLMERQLHQLAQQHQTLESTVHEHHRQNSAQVQTLQAQMLSQMEVQRSQMANMFDDQMSKLEMILAKKGRFEWNVGNRSASPKPAANHSSRAPRFLIWVFMFFSMFWGSECRIGEAKTPGPTAIDRTWTLGVCNPSGLPGKSVLLSGIDCDVINASETHLTATARSMLLTSLKSHSQYTQVITGALSQARINTSDAGQYTGVATIARVPTRALCAAWPPDLFETGRVQITGSLINNVWVSGAVMYGYPQGKTHQNAQSRSIQILDFLIDHMTQVATGPRYICGDLNHEIDQLPNLSRLQDLGWREAQDLEFQLRGKVPEPTCKGSTRKDMLWISPELVASFHTVCLDHDRFADHSVLLAEFKVDGAFASRFLWPMPQPVPWNAVPPLDFPLDFQVGAPTGLYMDLWQSKERQAQSALQHQWTPQMQGRGQRLTPLKRKGWAAPPRKGRSTDFQPAFHGYNVQHCRWLRQLRRLHSYHRWAAHHFGTAIGDQQLHGFYLWHSILRAPGFGSSFSAWWTSRTCVGLQDPGFVPTLPPDAAVARMLCEAFLGEVRAFERTLAAAKTKAQVHAHRTNPNLIYRDTKRPMPEPVTSLLVTKKTQVTELRPEDGAVLVDRSVDFDVGVPLLVDSRPVEAVHVTEDALYLADMSQVEVGSQVCQSRPIGRLEDVFAAFHTQWKQRWCRHDNVPFTHWDQLIAFARANMPQQHIPVTSITPSLLRAEAASKKPKAATGLDGVSRADLLQVDHNVLLNRLSQAVLPVWQNGKVHATLRTIGPSQCSPWCTGSLAPSMHDPCWPMLTTGVMPIFLAIGSITRLRSCGAFWRLAYNRLTTKMFAWVGWQLTSRNVSTACHACQLSLLPSMSELQCPWWRLGVAPCPWCPVASKSETLSVMASRLALVWLRVVPWVVTACFCWTTSCIGT